MHRPATPLRMQQFRSQSVDGVVLQLHGRAPILAVHVDTAAELQDGHDGLSCLRKICKAHLFVNWVGVINADLVVILNVSGSHQLGRILHEMITFSILGHRLHESSAL